MRQAEAERLILNEWDRWWRERGETRAATGNDGFMFYLELEKKNDPALDFTCRGDKWQTVHGWLLNARKVID